MEVSGKLGVQDSTIVCLPCDRDGLKEPAHGFCQDCQEHLCETCYKHHKRARPLRNHVLVDKDTMPKIQSMISATPDDTTDICPEHKDKALEFYCKNHKSVTCYVCVTLEHKHCQVDFIPNVSGNMSDEIGNMFEQIESLIKKCKSSFENANKAAKNLDQSHEKVVEDIKLFRKEINECLDKMESRIIREAGAIVENSNFKQKRVIATCKEIIKELECSKSLLNQLSEEKKRNKLFIEMKNAEKRLPILEDEEKQVLKANKTIDSITYIRNTRLIDGLKTESNFGQLTTRVRPSPSRTIDIQYTNSINVTSQYDKEAGDITGMVMMSPSKMIVADRNNKSIKMIDLERGKVLKEIRVSSSPSDVISLPENKVAVTLRKEKCIQILSCTETGFSSCHRIAVGELCNGVAYCQDKFIVSCYESRRIIILNLVGEILKVLDPPNILDGPLRVLISNDERFLYISDTDFSNKNKVAKIDWEDNVKNAFEEKKFNIPFGIQELEDQTLLVCYSGSDTLLRLSSSLKRCDMIGLVETDLFTPKIVTYCYKNNKLYVSCASKKGMTKADIVRVFNINWII